MSDELHVQNEKVMCAGYRRLFLDRLAPTHPALHVSIHKYVFCRIVSVGPYGRMIIKITFNYEVPCCAQAIVDVQSLCSIFSKFLQKVGILWTPFWPKALQYDTLFFYTRNLRLVGPLA